MKATYCSDKIRIVLSIIILICAALLSGCNESPDSQKGNLAMYVQQGKSYLQQHQFQAAFTAANKAVKANPDKVDGYLILAATYQKSGQAEQSIKVLESYSGVKESEYYFSLLTAYQKSGKLTSSKKIINGHQQLLAVEPQRFAFAQAQQWLYSNKLQEALQAFNQLVKDPDYEIDSMLGIARIEAVSQNHDGALKILDDIIELAPTNSEALILKSRVYIDKGDYINAEQTLSLALSALPSADIFTPDRIEILQRLTDVLTLQGRSAEAMIYSRILAEEFPGAESVRQQYTVALELFKKNQLTEAKKVLQEIIETAPSHKKSNTLLGLILYSEGDINNAEKHLSDVVDPETSATKLTELYAVAQLKLNKSDDVLALLENMPKEQYNNDTWALYVTAAIKEKQFEKAETALNQARKLHPDAAQLILLQALYYNRLTTPQPEKALQTLSAALQASPADPKLQTAYIKQLLILKRTSDTDNYVKQLALSYKNSTETQLIVASYRIHQKNFSDAEQILNKIRTAEAGNIQALYSLSYIYQIQQKWQLNLLNFKEIVHLYPQEIQAYRGLVLSLIQLRLDPFKSENHFPGNHEPSILALTLANLALQQNKLDLTTQLSQSADKGLPEKYQPLLNKLIQQLNMKKASAALAREDYKNARIILLDALKESPEEQSLLGLLANVEIRSGQYEEAQKITDQIAALLPDSPLSHILQADLHLAQDRPQQAVDSLQKEWQEKKNEFIAEKIYQTLNKTDPAAAVKYLADWRKEIPGSLRAIRHDAIYQQKQGKTKQALLLYEEILKKAPNEVTSLNNAAWIYFEQGNDRAVSLAKRAYNINPTNGAIVDTYGWILFNNGQQAAGKALIEKAVQLAPDEQAIKEHLRQINNKTVN
ncbi:tetratricopeptide repeat protein [Psychromonas ossibalaenae]|uniref:tetratricopeptide repeat protein n=1 Tax=Psychromonas ossibalaenae TaxID=444922 RepID=UPI00037D4757|nr:tetratricopeptide repeat protein [Psychromonas ossibalaenae]